MKKLTLLMMVLCLAAGSALAKAPLEKPLVPFQGDLRSTEEEPNDGCATANDLFVGDPMDAAIDPAGDIDWFDITVTDGECIIFETHPGNAGDTKLYLFDTLCSTQLAYDDDGGEGYYSLIQYTFEESGTYHLYDLRAS